MSIKSHLLSLYAFSSNINKEEEVTLDSLFEFLDIGIKDEVVMRDFMVFSGVEKTTLDSISDDNVKEILTSFSNSFDDADDFLVTVDSFEDSTTLDSCKANQERHITYHADGSKTIGCRRKKGAVKPKRTLKQRLADAKRKNKKMSASTKLSISRGRKKRAKHGR